MRSSVVNKRALLATTALVAVTAFAPGTVRAQDATWLSNPASGDYKTATNWSPATVPTGTAFFGTSNTTALTFSTGGAVGGWTFNAGASAYTFAFANNFSFTGAGIVINGGSASIINDADLTFINTSTAGSATFNNIDGSLIFNNVSTAGNATITNAIFGSMTFNSSSTAGNATITNTNNVFFESATTAGNAIITNSGNVFFSGTSAAGSATITNNNGGLLSFNDNSTGGNAAITNNRGGLVDFSTSNGPAGDNKLTAGSIAGAGSFQLGANELTVGGNNMSTEVSGVISGVRGSLVKVGTGTLTLSGTNIYTGATNVNAGTLNVIGGIGSTGTPSGAIGVLAGATLNVGAGAINIGNNVLSNAGTVTVQTGGTLTDGAGFIGNLLGSQGTVTVSGAGSTWTNTGNLLVGGLGTGTLAIQNGGTVNSAGGGSIGQSFGSTGTVTVTGPGSIWNNTPGGGLNIGSFGTGTLTIANGGMVINNTAFTANIGNGAGSQGTVTVSGAGSMWTNSSGVNIGNSGTGTLTIANGGIVTAPAVVIANNAGSIGTLNIGAGAGNPAAAPGTLTASSVAFGAGTGTINFNHTSADYVFAPAISGNGTVNVLAGTTILTGNNTYTGTTTVNAGTLVVNSSIASSVLTTVNAGGTLGGTGIVGNTVINTGGFLVPGSVGTPGTMTVTGNQAFQSGAFYVVQVNPTASSTNVSGTASLAGTVAATFAPGSSLTHSYTILTAAGGRSGTFDALATSGLPADFQASLSYPGNTAVLNLTAELVPEPPAAPPSNFPIDPSNVGRAIDDVFNNGGTLTPAVLPLFGMTGINLANALTQIDGEAATDAEKGAFKLMDQFLGLMLDPFADGRSGTGWPSGGGNAMGFAPEQAANFPPDVALAYAGVLKAPPKPAALDQRWSAWGGSFGGSNTTNGDPVIGSTNVTARDYGFAGGMDYHASPDIVYGFALAGGGTNWGLAQGLGGGRSDAFQAGVYGATRSGPTYVSAALAFANHWMTTDRYAFGGDHLNASFDGQSYAGRLEAGYRYAVLPLIGVTPYAALQVQDFHTPGYSETDLTGGGFALSYNSMSATDTRSELGARFDDMMMIGAMPLSLRARAAWAHDWVSNPNLMPVFQALPGSAFIVYGAAAPKNSALASAGAELHLTANWSLAAKFDGEFASGSQTYAGTGTLRYTW